MSIEITDHPDRNRFVAVVDGQEAGHAEYRRTDGQITFTHTVVSLEGQGVGSALVRHALDAVGAEGDTKVVPQCPFVKGWIDKHPDYQDLVA